MVSKNNHCLYSLMGVIRTVTNYENLVSLLYDHFYKIEFFPFRSPQIFGIVPEF